jgi:hypothetical protein
VRTPSKVFTIVAFCLAFSAVILPAANAYIDPGSGSMIFQAVVGGLLAAAIVVKTFWRRIVSLFKRGRTADET